MTAKMPAFLHETVRISRFRALEIVNPGLLRAQNRTFTSFEFLAPILLDAKTAQLFSLPMSAEPA
jgi:hypothetical protein